MKDFLWAPLCPLPEHLPVKYLAYRPLVDVLQHLKAVGSTTETMLKSVTLHEHEILAMIERGPFIQFVVCLSDG